jgi:chemotaxis protein MotB
MKKKPPPAGESCPLWYISFADMVTLLMAFFVMLAAFSSGASTDDSKLRQYLKSLQAAFGYQPSSSELTDLPDPKDLLEKLEQASMRNFKSAGSDQGPGRLGTVNTIKRTREGIEFTIGGQLGFDCGSVVLPDEAKAALQEIVEYIKGENNKVEVRGHSTRMECDGGRAFADEHQLAYARATAAADFLIAQGIAPERIRRVDCGSSEPLIVHAYDEQTKKANRRVEIIVTQALVHDFQGGENEAPIPPVAGPPAKQPADRASSPGSQVSAVPVQEGQ